MGYRVHGKEPAGPLNSVTCINFTDIFIGIKGVSDWTSWETTGL
jgi:hypothetical protein